MQFIWEYLGSINSGLMGGLLAAPALAMIAYSCKLKRPILLKLKDKPRSPQDLNWDIRFGTLWGFSFIGLLFLPVFGLFGVHTWVIDPMFNRESLTFVWIAPMTVIFPMFGISLYCSMRLCRSRGLKKGGMNYKRYAIYKALQYGIDPIKLENRMLRPLYVLSILGLAFTSIAHISINGSNLTHLPYLSFEKKEYNLADAIEIIIYSKSVAPNGDVIDSPSLVMKFSTGMVYNSDDDGLYLTEPYMIKLAKIVEHYADIKLIMSNSVNPY